MSPRARLIRLVSDIVMPNNGLVEVEMTVCTDDWDAVRARRRGSVVDATMIVEIQAKRRLVPLSRGDAIMRL